jgi:hypothetical protein
MKRQMRWLITLISAGRNQHGWTCVPIAIYEQARAQAGRPECPSVVIMDGESVKTTEHGGVRGFDADKRVKGASATSSSIRWACRSPTAWSPGMSDRRAGARLLAGCEILLHDLRWTGLLTQSDDLTRDPR